MNFTFRRLSVVAGLGALVGCDHATKYLAKGALEHQAPRQLVGRFLELRYVENRDVAFNMLRAIPLHVRGPLLVVFGAAAIIVLMAILLRSPPEGRAIKASLVMILAGAVGNYVDRLARGYVVDFIQVPHWPVFNVADVCVTAGAVLLLWAARARARRLGRQVRGT